MKVISSATLQGTVLSASRSPEGEDEPAQYGKPKMRRH